MSEKMSRKAPPQQLLGELIGDNIRRAAQEFGLSRQHIYRVLAGKQGPEKLLTKLVAAGKISDSKRVEISTRFAAEAGKQRSSTQISGETKRSAAQGGAAGAGGGFSLKFFRERRGYTLKELAERAGVPMSNIWNYERRGSSMTPATAAKIARTLGLSHSEIDLIFEHQQAVAPKKSRTGEAAWQRALFASLSKQGISVTSQDSFCVGAGIAPRIPASAMRELVAELGRRSRSAKQGGFGVESLDAVIRHEGDAASMVVLTVVSVQLQSVACDSPPVSTMAA